MNYDVMMDDAEPPSEFRLTSKISWSALWKDFNGLMTRACDGLMGNATALAQLKVHFWRSLNGCMFMLSIVP